ncbi:MAG: magnesium/cobalt transporter CorA [Acidimicrobiia bacterium]
MPIGVTCYRGGAAETNHAPEDISELVNAPGTVVWVDLADPSEADLGMLAEEFALHPLAIEDAIERHQRPKIEVFASHAFAVAYSRHLSEVAIFIGPTWVITVRSSNHNGHLDGHREPWDPSEARRRVERHGLDRIDVGILVYVIFDELVDGYFDEIDEHEDRLEIIEEHVFAEQITEERGVQRDLFEIRRHLMVFRRAVVPLREVVGAMLRREVPWVTGDAVVLLQDVYDHVLRAIDLIDGQRELMGNAVDAHLAIISNRMNQVMKKLTAWGAILFGASIIAGIYGMNFTHMPELRWYFGYPLAVGLMVILMSALYVIFRKRDWL